MFKFKPFICSVFLITGFVSNASEIYIADLKITKNQVTVGEAKNITNRPGYDNQPRFNDNGDGLYFTAMFDNNGKPQTDAMHYDLASSTLTNITKTPKFSEYSPTPIENDTHLSMIFVDETGSQKLWKTNIATGFQTPINLDIEPVGYHAWGKNNDLLLFVLGERMMLQYAENAKQKSATTITKDIGRSLRYNASKDLFSFSKGTEQQTLYTFDANTKQTQKLIPLPQGSQYYTWLNESIVISAQGTKLLAWDYQSSSTGNESDWRLLADLSTACKTTITRLAVSPQTDKLAFVCEEK